MTSFNLMNVTYMSKRISKRRPRDVQQVVTKLKKPKTPRRPNSRKLPESSWKRSLIECWPPSIHSC